MIEGVPEGGYLGIDPGKSGGIAYSHEDDIWVWPMPATLHEISDLLSELCFIARRASLEKVGGRPKQKGAMEFSEHVGFLKGILTATGVPFVQMPPATWEKEMGCLTGKKVSKKDKKTGEVKQVKKKDPSITRNAARKRWPHVKFTDKTAEAALISAHCRLYVE